MEKLKEFFNKSFGVIQNLLFHEYQSANPCNFYSEKMHDEETNASIRCYR